MATVFDNDEKLKDIFKTALLELLEERQDRVRAILEEIIEDAAFSRAIAEGASSPKVCREEVFELLKTAN